jgi:hypothetical protein
MSTALRVMDKLIETIERRAANMCQGCAHWREPAGWFAPSGWRRCKLTETDTSPYHGCERFKEDSGGQ